MNPLNVTSKMNRLDSLQTLILKYNAHIGIELGVREAFLSRLLVETTALQLLYGCDINECPNASKLEKEYPARYKFVKKESLALAKDFKDNFFDFIHHDSCHEQGFVLQELEAWYHKAKSGAIISGDDYMYGYNCPGEGIFGVVQAVNEFTQAINVELFVTGTEFTTKYEPDKLHNFSVQRTKERENGKIGPEPVPNWWFIKP